MKFLPLIWAGLWRKRTRTILTLLSITVAFLLFGLLQSINAGFANLMDQSRLDRLLVTARFQSITNSMPLAYLEKIALIPGVTAVAPWVFTGGYYQDPKNVVLVFASDERLFAAYPEFPVTPQQIAAFTATRTAMVASLTLAQKYGWKVGDNIPLQHRGNQPAPAITFDIMAIIENPVVPGQEFAIANYDYVDNLRPTRQGTVDRIVVRISDPQQSTQISAAIDELFASSTLPTRTMSEKANSQNLSKQVVDINLITEGVASAVFFMLLFLTSNTMTQSVRERIPEFAVLKTVGFSDTRVLYLVLGEAALLLILGCILGLVAAREAMVVLPSAIPIPDFARRVTGSVIISGLLIAVFVALISGLPPAWRVKQLQIVEALAGR